MPKSFQKPFRNAFVQIEFNSKVKGDDGEFEDNWEFVRSLECRIFEGVFVTRGVQYAKDDETKSHELHFRTDPALTVDHRIVYQGRIFQFIGSKKTTYFWIAYCLESSVEQPQRFMNMGGFGLEGFGIYPHIMSGGLALEFTGDTAESSSSSSSVSSLSSSSSSSSASSSASSASSNSSSSTSSSSSKSASSNSSSSSSSTSSITQSLSSSSSSTSSRSSSSNSSSSSTSSTSSSASSSSTSTSSNSSSSRL